MAITLDATLAGVQQSNVRHPIVELISNTTSDAAAPFEGNYFNTVFSDDETEPHMIALSSGRIALVYIKDNKYIYLMATDTEKTEWSEYLVENYSGNTNNYKYFKSVGIVEMPSGDLGIVYIYRNYFYGFGNYYLCHMVLNGDSGDFGTVKSTAASIANYTSSFLIDDIDIQIASDDSYVMLYQYRDDSNNYYIAERTSSDFSTWSNQSLITPSGTDITRKICNPALLITAQGTWFLAYDYVTSINDSGAEITNIFQMRSTDSGSTWGVPEQITTETIFGRSYYCPDYAQRTDGDIVLSYTKRTNVLYGDKNMADFCNYVGSYCHGELLPTDMHYDPTSGKLFLKNEYVYVGDKVLCSALVIDVDEWKIDHCYVPPEFNEKFSNSHVWSGRHQCHGGQFINFGNISTDTYGNTVSVIDHVNSYVYTFQFNKDDAEWNISKNMDAEFTGTGGFYLQNTFYDNLNSRLYCLFINSYVYTHRFKLGYIEIFSTPNPDTGYYEWHEILDSNLLSGETLYGNTQLLVIPEKDWAILSFYQSVDTWYGRTIIVQINSKGIVKDYNYADYNDYPRKGMGGISYFNNHLYGRFPYLATYGEGSKIGLLDINLITDEMIYRVPSYKTATDYGFNYSIIDPAGILILSTDEDGIVTYNINDGTWTQYNNTTLPGMTPNGQDVYFGSLAYDPASGTIFAACNNYPSETWYGLIAFSIYGDFRQGYYLEANYSSLSGTWDFTGTPEVLTENHFDRENTICVDEDNALWTTWVRQDNGNEYSLEWDKEKPSLHLENYLLNELEVTWSVDKPNALKFSLSHGHLFDTHNTMSVFAKYLKKTRVITLQFGEIINNTEYWEKQGNFLVISTEMSYEREKYPVITVNCEDQRVLWADTNITASAYFDGKLLSYVSNQIAQLYGGYTVSEINIGTLNNDHLVYYQVLDRSVDNVMDDILSHLGYFACVDVDGILIFKEYDLEKSPDNIYTDRSMIIDYSPDDSYSDFINKIVVKGEQNGYIEVMYDQESIKSLNGTVGWWGEKKVKRIWYSDDHTRKCRNPSLKKNQSIEDFKLFLFKGGGTEYISDTDEDEKWCEITIEGPNLVYVVVAEVALLIILGSQALFCDGLLLKPGMCGFYIWSSNMCLSILLYTLSCIASYNYDIMAYPLGNVKQTCQGEANDYELQTALGVVVLQEIDDPFCYTEGECTRVAELNLDIKQVQRKRIKFKKVYNLQDEVGDMIQIVHPHSKRNINIFITNLVRSFRKPGYNENNGGCFDSIEGWVVEK